MLPTCGYYIRFVELYRPDEVTYEHRADRDEGNLFACGGVCHVEYRPLVGSEDVEAGLVHGLGVDCRRIDQRYPNLHHQLGMDLCSIGRGYL